MNNKQFDGIRYACSLLNDLMLTRKIIMECVPVSKQKEYAGYSRDKQDAWMDKRREIIKNNWPDISIYDVIAKFDFNDYQMEYQLSRHYLNYWIVLSLNRFYDGFINTSDIQKACKTAHISTATLKSYYEDAGNNLKNSRGYAYYKASIANGHSLDQMYNIDSITVPELDEVNKKFKQISKSLLDLFISRSVRHKYLPIKLEEKCTNDELEDYHDYVEETWGSDCLAEIMDVGSDYTFEHDYYAEYFPVYGGNPFAWLEEPDIYMYLSDFKWACEYYDLDFNIFRAMCMAEFNHDRQNNGGTGAIDFDDFFTEANEKQSVKTVFTW